MTEALGLEVHTQASLAGLGLGERTEAVYRAMIRRPRWSVDELVEATGLSTSAVQAGLDELADFSLIRPSGEEPGAVVVVKPGVALAELIAAQQREIHKRQHKLAECRVALSDIVAEFEEAQEGPGGGRIEYLRGTDSVRGYLDEISERIETEVLAFIPKASLTPESMAASQALDARVVERGATIRTIYLDSVRNHSATRRYAAWLNECGGQVRTHPVLPMRLILVDRKLAVLPIDPEESTKGALVVREQGIVAALLALFSHIWDSARPLGTAELPDDQGLSPQERELLRLLAQGMTDEAASKQLALSVRSVRRLMSDIMDRLNARSRFEAGLRVAERGWL
ncbi:LuxR C-terminal-related transcriptional regulator [Streptomyces sp. NPDC096152]|uniref:LuxR C-terminal-related transcriptional regulator n=1 Tax=Streptomyces sp. NPDC096152 TaxID=3366078 RepID=UPI0037F68641